MAYFCRARGPTAAEIAALVAGSQMSQRALAAVCQAARFSALLVLLGVLFPWVRVRGKATYLSDEGYAITVLPGSVEGFQTADGVCILILGIVAIVAIAIYKNVEKAWALVLASLSSLAITAVAIASMASLQRLARDWPEPREASVHFGLYMVLVASVVLSAAIAALVRDYTKKSKPDRPATPTPRP